MTYAKTDHVPSWINYLSAGKEYEVLREKGGEFLIIADDDISLTCSWNNGLGCNWTRIEGDQATQEAADHPNGEDYFNRAQRAEAEAADWRAIAETLAGELDCRVGDIVMLRKAIEANDPRAEWFVRLEDMLRESRIALANFNTAKGAGE